MVGLQFSSCEFSFSFSSFCSLFFLFSLVHMINTPHIRIHYLHVSDVDQLAVLVFSSDSELGRLAGVQGH